MAASLQSDVRPLYPERPYGTRALYPGRLCGTRLPRPGSFSIEHVPCVQDREAHAEANAALVTFTARARAPAPRGSHPLPQDLPRHPMLIANRGTPELANAPNH